MAYVLKLLTASAAALIVAGLAIQYSPWELIAHGGDIVIMLYLGVICVALPGFVWFGAMKVMRIL